MTKEKGRYARDVRRMKTRMKMLGEITLACNHFLLSLAHARYRRVFALAPGERENVNNGVKEKRIAKICIANGERIPRCISGLYHSLRYYPKTGDEFHWERMRRDIDIGSSARLLSSLALDCENCASSCQVKKIILSSVTQWEIICPA